MNKRLSILLLLTVTIVPSWASPITVTSSSVGVHAYDGYANGQQDTNTSINHTATLSGSVGNSESTTDINWTGDEFGTVFLFDTTHAFNNLDFSGPDVASSDASLFFTATDSVDYGISAFYAASGGEANRTTQLIYLRDLTTSTYLFFDYAESYEEVDESFVIGDGTGGDDLHEEIGSLTGSLVAGHDYKFRFYQAIQEAPVSGVIGSGIGQVCLITGASNASCGLAVPEPMGIALLALGLFGMSVRRQSLGSAV